MAMSMPATAMVRAPRASDHFWLLVQARWQSYRNALRKSDVQRAKLATAILAAILVIIGGLASAAAFLGMGYVAGDKGKVPLLGMAALFVFLLWQLAPILFEATTPTIKFRDIARYPVAFRTFFTLHLAYGLLDPSAIVGIVWLTAIWIGLLFGRPPWAGSAVVPFALFAAANLFANRFLMTLLDRVLATRRGREAVLVVAALLGIATQIVIGIAPRYASAAAVKKLLPRLALLWTWSPPGIASWTVNAGSAKYAVGIVALMVYSALAALLLRWQLRGVFCGEIYSEARRLSGAVQMRPGWSLPLLSDATSAIVEKELRYFLRDSRTMMNVAMPLVFALIVTIGRGATTRIFAVGLKVQTTSSSMQVMFSAATVFVLAYVAYNCFGLEGAGFQRWPLSPAKFRQVLTGKNVALALLWSMSWMAVNVVLCFGEGYSFAMAGVCLIGLLYAGLAILAAGNQFSVRLPLKVDPTSITSTNMNSGTMLGNMLLVVVLAATAWAGVQAGRWMASPWITPAVFAMYAVIAAALYAASLRNAATYLERNVEKIASELG